MSFEDWAGAGTRPTFKLVTGISTGALIAPYAFLGSDYDAKLEEVFTTVTNKDVYRFRSPLTVLKNDSLSRLVGSLILLRSTIR